jgi:hypothetical protein
MKIPLILATIIISSISLTCQAQSIEDLQQQLEAQKQINALLKQRIQKLELELAESRGQVAGVASSRPLDNPETTPERQAGDPEESRALERALVRKGLAILPSGQWELTPGLVWLHSGSELFRTRRDDYLATLEARVGLPWDSMVGIGLPYYIKSDREYGDNSGFGDLSLRVWKQLLAPGESSPSLVGSLAYIAPTGEDPDDIVPLGSHYHRLGLKLNLSQSIDPLVLYGDISYSYSFSEDINSRDYRPGDSIGIRGGTSLAITPSITGNLGLSFSFVDEFQIDGEKLDGSEQTIGLLEVGMGFSLSKRYFLSLTGDIGITDDAPDFALGASLPIRF